MEEAQVTNSFTLKKPASNGDGNGVL